jgi:hypothetical protein
MTTVSPVHWLLLLLQNSDALTLNQFSKNLELLGNQTVQTNTYWNLFLLICNFSKIMFYKFSLTEKSSGRCLHIDSNTFVLLELMFYLFLKRSLSEDFDQNQQMRMQGTNVISRKVFRISSRFPELDFRT